MQTHQNSTESRYYYVTSENAGKLLSYAFGRARLMLAVSETLVSAQTGYGAHSVMVNDIKVYRNINGVFEYELDMTLHTEDPLSA